MKVPENYKEFCGLCGKQRGSHFEGCCNHHGSTFFEYTGHHAMPGDPPTVTRPPNNETMRYQEHVFQCIQCRYPNVTRLPDVPSAMPQLTMTVREDAALRVENVALKKEIAGLKAERGPGIKPDEPLRVVVDCDWE